MNPSAAEVAACVLKAVARGERVYTAVITDDPGRSLTGRRLWWAETDGGGSLGARGRDEAVAKAVKTSFAPSLSRGAASLSLEIASGRIVQVYAELHGPAARMVIVGAGHIAVPLSRVGALLGLRVEVLDDRERFARAERFPRADVVRVIDFRDPFADTPLAVPDHVVLVTRGHSFDYECLVRLLRMRDPPGYIGMIGSRRRVRATHAQLAGEGFGAEDMARVRAPVGLDLGGQSPAEIAVSVAAEIVMLRSGGTGKPLVAKERVAERYFGGRK